MKRTLLFVLFAGIAFGKDPGPSQFPIIGIGLGQTLRLTAVAKDPGPVGAPATGCVATLGFVDLDGVQKQPGPINKPVSLAPGQSDFLDFPASLLLRRFSERAELRPVVSFTAAGGATDCAFFAEVFDQFSGFSQVYVNPGPVQLPGETGTFPLMGVAFGQVMRLTAVAKDPGPVSDPAGACVVRLGFVDRNGVQPGPVQSLTLDPGEGGFLDIAAAGIVTRFGQRALIRPVQ
jgi:hypothetical protein